MTRVRKLSSNVHVMSDTAREESNIRMQIAMLDAEISGLKEKIRQKQIRIQFLRSELKNVDCVYSSSRKGVGRTRRLKNE